MSTDYRPILTKGIEETRAIERSPFMHGLLAGTKGFFLGGTLGAAVQAARGKSALTGALIGGLGTGLLTGLSRAIEQEVVNQEAEGDLRYYVARMKEREPLMFMPPPPVFGKLFSRFHREEHAPPKK